MTRDHVAFALVLIGLIGVTILAVLTLPFVFGRALQMAYGVSPDDSINLQLTLGFWGWVLSIAMIVGGVRMKS